MLEVKGFRGYRFAEDKVGNLDNVITPPFDVIGPDERDALAARSPYNMTHAILPKERAGRSSYQCAADDFKAWIDEGAQRQDEEDSLYLLEQHFEGLDGKNHRRRAFFAIAKIPEAGEDTILGHERTFPRKIEDRLALTQATRANLGPILMLYADPDKVLAPFLAKMDEQKPIATARTSDAVTLHLWRTPHDPNVTEFFHGRKLYIADGHHRFATAVAYRDEMREREQPAGRRPYDYVLVGLAAFDDPGLFVYPAHRVLDPPEGFNLDEFQAKLDPYFRVTPVENRLAERVAAEDTPTFGLALHGGGQFLLQLKDIDRTTLLGDDHAPAWRSLDVAVLHRGILERIMGLPPDAELIYEPDTQKALAHCQRGTKEMVFLMNGATPGQIRACADAGEYMPQKATYLFPKLPTGAVIHRLE